LSQICVLDDVVVYRNPYPSFQACEASHTTLCATHSGGLPELLAGFAVGQARASADRRFHLYGSRDGGRSWQGETTPLAEPTTNSGPVAHAGPQLGSLTDGSVVLALARFSMTTPGKPDWVSAVGGIVDADALIAVHRSGSRPIVSSVDLRRHADEWAIPCGPVTEVAGGRLLLPMERHTLPRIAGWQAHYHAFAAVSTDGGQHWADAGPTLNDPHKRVVYYDQRFAALPDGRLLTLAWTHDVASDSTLAARCGWSDDGGLSWSPPADTPLCGGPLYPLVLPDGRLLVAFTRKAAPAGIRVTVSEDFGGTWLTDAEVVVWDDELRAVTGERASVAEGRSPEGPLWGTMWGATFGSPALALTGANDVVMVFYCAGADGVRHVRCVRLAA